MVLCQGSRSEEHTSELQSLAYLVCRLLLEKKNNFVVRGNYIVGFVVFFILVLINFIVITKGAGRIAEVAARFTLDAMPGKQMAIDAELSAGVITEAEARTRRKKVEQEADFYGAMDGASKFFFLVIRPPPISTLFPYTTLFRSSAQLLQDGFLVGEDLSLVGDDLFLIGQDLRLVGQNGLLVLRGSVSCHESSLPTVRRLRRLRDRKSTRLNSSH